MPLLNEKLMHHPCFGIADCGTAGRIHLPVAPRCNLQCVFCDRKYDCVNESRPGVTSKILTPEEALLCTEKAIRKEPRIRVAGIAGPGDSMVNPETFHTLSLLRNKFPELLLCLSTNGLALPEHMEELIDLKVDTITITINAASVETGLKIYDSVFYGKKELSNKDSVALLLEKQKEGLKACLDAGIFVKINTVLIPGVNDHEIEKIAQLDSRTTVMNIMPLIPCGRLKSIPGPSNHDLETARNAAGKYIRQFTHCRQCRSDACGIL